MQDTGYRIQDTGYRILDIITGYWILDTVYTVSSFQESIRIL